MELKLIHASKRGPEDNNYTSVFVFLAAYMTTIFRQITDTFISIFDSDIAAKVWSFFHRSMSHC